MSKKNPSPDQPENHLVVFQEKAIRRSWHNEEWWFSVADVVAVLTDETVILRVQSRTLEVAGYPHHVLSNGRSRHEAR